MPQLNILQHKSYHPYLEKNKQRVREDEAKARAAELALEQARIEGASVERLNELRKRAGSPSFQAQLLRDARRDGQEEEEEDNLPSTSSVRQGEGSGSSLMERHKKEKARQEKREKKVRDRLDFEWPSETAKKEAKRAERRKEMGYTEEQGRERERDEKDRGPGGEIWETDGHINLFADLEREHKAQPSLAEIAKKKKEQEADQFTVYLNRPERETKPWYTDKELKRYEERELGDDAEERRARDKRKDARSKNRHDPLTTISTLLKPITKSSTSHHKARTHPHPKPSVPERSAQEARLSRETSERQRAAALIAKAKADKERAKRGRERGRWDDTPSSAGFGRSWADDLEREKDRAGHRFYDVGNGDGRGGAGDRSWEV